MTDAKMLTLYHKAQGTLEGLRAVAQAAREEEREAILHETVSTVVKACAALVRLTAPDDVDEHYVPRAAVVDIALGLQRDMKAIRSRSAAGEQCVTPNGRTDGHMSYVNIKDGAVTCAFCGKGSAAGEQGRGGGE